MSFIKKILSALKTEDDNLLANKPLCDDNGERLDRRSSERFLLKTEFCIFLWNHNLELDMEKAPFLLADLDNISSCGAAYSCVSRTACTPYSPDVEEELKVSSHVWLVPNVKVDFKSCNHNGCNVENKEPQIIEISEAIKGEVLWVKSNQFGCLFKSEKDKVLNLIENLKKLEV